MGYDAFCGDGRRFLLVVGSHYATHINTGWQPTAIAGATVPTDWIGPG